MSLNKKIFLITCLSVLALVSIYGWFKQEVVIFANEDIDNYGFTASVTCRHEMLTYYPYLVIKSSQGMEVSRAQINGLGYEALQACRVSFPVERLELVADKRAIRMHFSGRNAFGDLSTLDIPVSFFSPR
jgi:hypothetical protein